MRICHVIESAGAGTGQVVSDLARLQKEAGHDVTVVYAPGRAEPYFIEALNAASGLKIVQKKMLRPVGPHDLVHALSLWWFWLRQEPYDIIHGHSSKAGALVRMAGLFLPSRWARSRRPKIVYTPHAFITMEESASKVFRCVEWFLSFFADAIIATSEMEKKHAVEVLKIKAEKVHVILNGIKVEVAADRQAARKRLGIAQEVPLLGFVGRLAKQKNIPRLLEIFRLCRAVQPSLKLAILGDGEEREETEKTIAANGWQDDVLLFQGLKARDFYPAFDVFVNSSNYESFGLILIEALAAGVPVVTTPVGIAVDAITNDVTGWVCPFEAPAMAQAALKALALDAEARGRMREAGLAAAQAFSDKAMADKTMALYAALS